MYLAGDVGGTKTRLGLFSAENGPRRPIAMDSFPTVRERSPERMVARFLDGRPVERGVLGVAGAVLEGRAGGSNLPWEIREAALCAAAGAPVRLMNDLEAIATFLPELGEDDLVTLQRGRAQQHGAMAVIAPGTGLGQAMLVWLDGRHRALRSEAGHVDFAPNDELQDAYLRFLRARHGHVSLERACSGSAMPGLLEFLVAGDHAAADADVAREVASSPEPTRAIVEAALAERCPACVLALDTFVAMLGAAAGDLALQVVATGGIFLGGGIPPRILPVLRGGRLQEAFRHKGRFRDLMARIPLRVITDDRVALWGAALQAIRGA